MAGSVDQRFEGFRSTLPRGERLASRAAMSLAWVFRSTLPRGERHGAGGCRGPVGVSIHAPAWGATVVGIEADPPFAVSIHAPAWGATGRVMRVGMVMLFRSTLPRGERRCARRGGAGASGFDPRSRVGSDARRYPVHSRPACFDPRSRVGSDKRRAVLGRILDVSIHAPAWGATVRLLRVGHRIGVSIHAPAWGATRPPSHQRFASQSFDPRSRVGSDQVASLAKVRRYVSIHAPAWGATRAGRLFRIRMRVSIHAPAWGATPAATDVPEALAVSIHAPAWGATAERDDARVD